MNRLDVLSSAGSYLSLKLSGLRRAIGLVRFSVVTSVVSAPLRLLSLQILTAKGMPCWCSLVVNPGSLSIFPTVTRCLLKMRCKGPLVCSSLSPVLNIVLDINLVRGMWPLKNNRSCGSRLPQTLQAGALPYRRFV